MAVAVHPPLVAAMLDPAFYPHRPDSVELRETHISWVFRAGELAYKLKKPVVLPFLDYGTAARRGEMCKEEVLLNRRLAPRLYRRVVSIVPCGDGYELADVDDPAAIDYAVEMGAVEEDRSLQALHDEGILSSSDVEAIGHLLAQFHQDARVVRGPEALSASLEPLTENLATLRGAGEGILDLDRVRAAAPTSIPRRPARRSTASSAARPRPACAAARRSSSTPPSTARRSASPSRRASATSSAFLP